MKESTIHLVNGSAASGTIRVALRLTPGVNLLVSHDLYSCGPLPPIESLEDWRRSRETWWVNLYPRQGERLTPNYLRWPAELLDHLDALQTCNSIILWIGTGLADQILLVFLVHVLQGLHVPLSRLQVIQYDRIGPGSLGVVIGTGELNEDQFRAHPEPKHIAESEVDASTAAWLALTASEPDKLATFCSARDRELPWLKRALRALLLRYPEDRSGLGIWDRAALEYTVEKGPVVARIVGFMMAHGREQPDHTGDVYLYDRLQRIGAPNLPEPLLSLNPPNKPMRETTVEITDAGRAVLNGEANAVALNGIDDWVAGVHLDSMAGRVWFHKDGELIEAK